MDNIFGAKIYPNGFARGEDKLICGNYTILWILKDPEKPFACYIYGNGIFNLTFVKLEFVQCGLIVGIRYTIHEDNSLKGWYSQNNQND